MEPKSRKLIDMRTWSKLLCVLFILVGIFACEEPFVPEPVENAEQYVVEGYVEAGEGSNFSYVIITKTVPFFSEISPDQYASLFVDDATVTVNDGSNDVTFTKLCLSDIPDDLKDQAGELIGINPDSTDINVCIYVDIFDQLIREVGRTYSLEVTIENEEEIITAQTTIPEIIPLYDFVFRDTPGVPIEGLAQLWCKISDPLEKNYYRYFTQADSTALISPFNSVTNDGAWNGQEFEFPISKAEPAGADFDPNTFGMFTEGDTIIMKWCTIDSIHYDFWETFEYARNNQGPFSAYTRIKTNVDGAWGIFGGYGVSASELVVEK